MLSSTPYTCKIVKNNISKTIYHDNWSSADFLRVSLKSLVESLSVHRRHSSRRRVSMSIVINRKRNLWRHRFSFSIKRRSVGNDWAIAQEAARFLLDLTLGGDRIVPRCVVILVTKSISARIRGELLPCRHWASLSERTRTWSSNNRSKYPVREDPP